HPGAPAAGEVPAAAGGRRRRLRPGHRRAGPGQHSGDPGPPGRPAGRAVHPRWPAASSGGAHRSDGCNRLRSVAPGEDAVSHTDTKSTVLLKHHLKALKLPTVLAECEKVAQRAAADNIDHLAFLLQVCELELIERERKAAERRLKAARFPAAKTL